MSSPGLPRQFWFPVVHLHSAVPHKVLIDKLIRGSTSHFLVFAEACPFGGFEVCFTPQSEESALVGLLHELCVVFSRFLRPMSATTLDSAELYNIAWEIRRGMALKGPRWSPRQPNDLLSAFTRPKDSNKARAPLPIG